MIILYPLFLYGLSALALTYQQLSVHTLTHSPDVYTRLLCLPYSRHPEYL